MKIIKSGGRECLKELSLEVNWSLTAKCNYRCSYCIIYGKGKTPPPQLPFPTLEQLQNAVDNIASLNRPWYDITLSGGEPTIHPHFFDLISMLHDKLGDRLNRVQIVTNGSRNENLYQKLSELSKSVNIGLILSIHTEYVDMSHILNLIELLSHNVSINFSLMFNPEKREFVHEIYDKLYEYRKKFYFVMTVMTLRDGDRVDPRYTPEDFAWQKEAMNKFNDLVKSLAGTFPPRRRMKTRKIFHTIEENGEIKEVGMTNKALELSNGLLHFKGMHCIASSALLFVMDDGRCRGMVCTNDKYMCNIYDKNCFQPIRDTLIHDVICNRNICGCGADNYIPKFSTDEDAKNYLAFAQKQQAQMFAEYDLAQKKQATSPVEHDLAQKKQQATSTDEHNLAQKKQATPPAKHEDYDPNSYEVYIKSIANPLSNMPLDSFRNSFPVVI